MQREWLMVAPRYRPSEPSYLLSVRMPPLGAYRVMGIPLGEVAEDVLELDEIGPKPAPGFAAAAGFAAGLCWVAGSFGINYLFEQRPLRLFLINGGYHTVQYTVIGLILGLWH